MGGLVVAQMARGRARPVAGALRSARALASSCSARRTLAPTRLSNCSSGPTRSRSNWRCWTRRPAHAASSRSCKASRASSSSCRRTHRYSRLARAGVRLPRVRRGAEEPDATLLKSARTNATALEPEAMALDVVCNVAGTAPRTVFGVELQDGRVVLKLTTEGDGRVTHQSRTCEERLNLVRRCRAWRSRLRRADIRRHPGTTRDRRPRSSSSTRRRAPAAAARAYGRRFPSRSSTRRNGTSRVGCLRENRTASPRTQARARAGFLVTVVHGDLSFARFPIVVGHYESDTIIGAEAVIDRLFDGALTTRYDLGLYPGPLGTHAVVVREPTPLQQALQLPPGAVVVGLGRWGELTAGADRQHHPSRRNRVRVAARQLSTRPAEVHQNARKSA